MAGSPEGGTTGQRARSKRVVNEEIVQDRAPDLDTGVGVGGLTLLVCVCVRPSVAEHFG